MSLIVNEDAKTIYNQIKVQSLFLPIVPPIFLLILLFLFAIIIFYYKPLRTSSGLFFGFVWVLLNAYSYQSIWFDNNINPSVLAKHAKIVQGKVISLQSADEKKDKIDSKEYKLRFNFKITHIEQHALAIPINVRLSWKNPSIIVKQGQILALKVKIKPAHGLANLGGFNYLTWLKSKKISATGYVANNKSKSKKSKSKKLKPINHFNAHIVNDSITTRQQLFSQYQQLLPKHELSSLMLALGFGDRSQLNPNLWKILQATGTGHLIAISGLHIGLVATGSFLLVMLLVRLLPFQTLSKLTGNTLMNFNVCYVAVVSSLLLSLCYGYLAGFSLPTVRALVMLFFYWAFRLVSCHISIKRWLLLTLFVLVISSPFSLFTASFWLSCYAVCIIFLTLWRFKFWLKKGAKSVRFIKVLLVIQLSLTFMLLPISALFFQQFSMVALLANLVAVPWMSFITIPLCLLSVLVMPLSESLSQVIIFISLQSIELLWIWLEFLAQQPMAIINVSSHQVHGLIATGAIFAIVLFLSPKIQTLPLKSNWVSAFVIVFLIMQLLIFNLNSRSSSENKVSTYVINSPWQLVVFDVGQGLSVLIKRDQHAILYDTGAAYPSGFTMVDAVVLPYLQHKAIHRLDKVIISHSDNDHAGGLATLLENTAIDEVIMNSLSESDFIAANKKSVCIQGKSFSWQGLTFKMLWPEDVRGKENDDSCVLLISDGKHQVLLSGDISQSVEKKLLKRYPKLHADVLLVPHHGSKTSSSKMFLSVLSPQVAIVSAGFLNRWRMPVSSVVKHYQTQKITLVNTAISGQVILTFSEEGITKQTFVDDLWPFWFAN
ncbi:MAG: DNA internalization-related competence protein ComEC/Rec2 [Colwellia sp.]